MCLLDNGLYMFLWEPNIVVTVILSMCLPKSTSIGRMWHKVNFLYSTTHLNSEFSFSQTSRLKMLKDPVCLIIYPWLEGEEMGSWFSQVH